MPANRLNYDTTPNDPASPAYNPGVSTWIGKTFSFNGGAPTQIDMNDDDPFFQDGYVETGGAQTLAQNVTIDGTLYTAGSVVENEFSLINGSGQEIYVVRINGVNVGFTYAESEGPTVGETFTAAQGLDGAPADNAGGMSSSDEPYASVICFAAGTRIETPDGPRPVENLEPGDVVATVDNGPMPILWARHNIQPLDFVVDDGKPVILKAGALGKGRPITDLIVSPQHRILVGGSQLAGLFSSEVLVPAKSLTSLQGIRHMKGKRAITWVHFACERHEVVIANGCLSESLLLGPMAVNVLTNKEQRVLAEIFRNAPISAASLNGPPARDCLTVRQVRRYLAVMSEVSGRQTKSVVGGA
jgi:hypothetical protein